MKILVKKSKTMSPLFSLTENDPFITYAYVLYAKTKILRCHFSRIQASNGNLCFNMFMRIKALSGSRTIQKCLIFISLKQIKTMLCANNKIAKGYFTINDRIYFSGFVIHDFN